MNDIYKILASFNKVAQEPAKAETKPVAKTQLQESMEQVLTKRFSEAKQKDNIPNSPSAMRRAAKSFDSRTADEAKAAAKQAEKKHQKEGVDEAKADYSAKKARAGQDIGKPGKQFAKIAKSAGERYGSKERGEKVAGAVLKKLRAKESVVSEKKQAKNPYAIGMAQAMKSTGDKPPLKKSTIKKAHDIAKKIDEDESKEVHVYADGKKVKSFANRKLAQTFINHHKEHNKQFSGKKLTIKENITFESVPSEIPFNGKTVDLDSIEIGGVDTRDYPDFSDAHIIDASYTNGRPLTDDELIQFQEENRDLIHQIAHDSLSETSYGVAEGKKPDYIDLDKDGNKTEPMKKAAKDAKKKKMAEEVRVHKGKYGTEYQGDDDEDDGKKAEPAKKKGRGRPKKGSDITGHVAKYSTDALSKAMGGGEKPKAKAKPSAVHKMKESTSKIDRMVNEAMDPEVEKSALGYEQHQLKKHLGDDTYDELIAQLEQGQGPSEAIMDQLMSYYMDKMPYGTAQARDGDPYEWINNKLDELFPYVGDRRPEDYMGEDDMEEGNAFSKAVVDAKKDGIQPGEKITVGGKEYPVKEDDGINEMKRLAGLAECGDMSPISGQSSQQQSRMDVTTTMSSMGEKSVNINATGQAADDLMQMLTLSGMQAQATPVTVQAVDEEKDSRYEASTTPDETVLPIQAQTKGGDGDVAGEEKDMDPDGSARFSDNPMAVKKVKEEIDSLENMGLNLLRDYNSIKKETKK